MHIHLDAVGGVAGDMFVGALLDAFPEFREEVTRALDELHLPYVRYRCFAHVDFGLRGSRFVVELADHSHDHEHRSYSDICRLLQTTSLSPRILRRAINILTILADAEAHVHASAREAVEFHEVGAWDSIVDIVAAAFLIERLADTTWSISDLPLGGGRVLSAHGVLPVPAPAVVRLIEGLAVFDDGVTGERVTPTGAAIVKALRPQGVVYGRRQLTRSGTGFGTRQLPGVPNILRCLVFDETGAAAQSACDQIGIVEFDVDDQTAEDLAAAINSICRVDGVIEHFQSAVFGKKGRLSTQVRFVVEPAAIDRIADACLHETTTLGVRWHLMRRKVLKRRMYELDLEGERLIVKVAERIAGDASAKTDIDSVAHVSGANRRACLRQRAEEAALAQWHSRAAGAAEETETQP